MEKETNYNIPNMARSKRETRTTLKTDSELMRY